jgi:hypothetical protein
VQDSTVLIEDLLAYQVTSQLMVWEGTGDALQPLPDPVLLPIYEDDFDDYSCPGRIVNPDNSLQHSNLDEVRGLQRISRVGHSTREKMPGSI